MLITQGELDYRVPLSESMTTYKLLQRLKVPTRFVLFPDEGHWILKGPNSRRHMDEVLGWLRKYLRDTGTPTAPPFSEKGKQQAITRARTEPPVQSCIRRLCGWDR